VIARASAVGLVLALAAAPVGLLAHHSATAAYGTATMVLKGRVARFAWTNPHCHAYIDVAEGAFKGRTYTVELSSPAALTAEGWTKTTMKPGDRIEMTVHPSRTGAAIGLCRRCAMTINGTPWRGAAAVE